MVKPIRIDHIEFDPKVYLTPEQFKDYQDLEGRLPKLSPLEKRYYDLLRQWAYLKHLLALKELDSLLK